MKRSSKIVLSQQSARKILSLVFVVVFALIQLIAIQTSIIRTASDKQETGQKSGNSVEIQNTVIHNFLPVKLAEGQQSVTELHRLGSLALLSNRIISANSFLGNDSIQLSVHRFITGVPIFILGHALLN